MTAGVLAQLGLTFGPTLGPSKWNPKGYFENEAVRENVLKPMIRSAGGDSRGQGRFPDASTGNAQWTRDAVLRELRGATAYKDAKICLMWDVWTRAFPDSLYVIVMRDPRDVATSCLRAKFMERYSTQSAWEQWARAYQALSDNIAKRCEAIYVWPDGSPDVFRPVAEFAGLKWNEEAVSEFVDPTMWHAPSR